MNIREDFGIRKNAHYLDRIVSLRYNNNEQTAFNYTYNRFGSVSAITDTASGIAKIYDYDTVGRLISARTENGTNDVFRTHYTYDGLSRLDTLKYVYSTAAGTQYTHEYSATYGEDNRVNTFGLNGIFSITPTFDGLGRQSSRVLKNGSGVQVEKEDYAFLAGNVSTQKPDATTTLIGSATYYGAGTTGTQYSYEYDKTGNLTAIKKNGTTLHTYTYDSLGQLTSWYDAATDKTVHYGYYKGGNLKSIYDGEDTVSFVYNNGDGIADRLMVYDGQLLSYDEIGNPLKFRDGISMTWKNGRQLATLTNGQTSASYDYDENGIRTKKTVNGITTTYQLDGSKIVSENRNGTVQSYFYDENGSVLGITYGGENYYFRKNFRNDVLAILNASGEVVVEYSYDPWGNILAVTGSLASTLGADNPFRYRGYYYDTESCFYYLNSRYYDAKVCRFVNADNYISTGQGLLCYNMFSYCLNNPINRVDFDGHESVWAKIKNFFKNTFGAGAEEVYRAEEKVEEYAPGGLNLFVSWSTGFRKDVTIKSYGDSTKPISVGAEYRADSPLLSSVNLSFNFSDSVSLKFNLGLEDIGISTSITSENTTDSFGLTADISKRKIGVESSKTQKNNDNTSDSFFYNSSITGGGLFAVIVACVSGDTSMIPALIGN